MKFYCDNHRHSEYVDPAEFENLTIWQTRLKMAQNGWISKIKYANDAAGKDENGIPNYSFTIWFKRWDWHGYPFGSYGHYGCTGADSTIERIQKSVKNAALKCLKDWNEITTEYPENYLKDNSLPNRDPIIYSEKIPDIDILCESLAKNQNDPFIESINEIRNKKYSYHDEFKYIATPLNEKYEGREWELKFEILQEQQWHKTNLHHYPYQIKTDNLVESLIVDTIKSAGHNFDKFYQHYSKIPPGGLTVEEGIEKKLFE